MVNNKYNKLLYKKYNIKYNDNVEKKVFGGTKRDEGPSELNSGVKKIKITDGTDGTEEVQTVQRRL